MFLGGCAEDAKRPSTKLLLNAKAQSLTFTFEFNFFRHFSHPRGYEIDMMDFVSEEIRGG